MCNKDGKALPAPIVPKRVVLGVASFAKIHGNGVEVWCSGSSYSTQGAAWPHHAQVSCL